MASFLAALLLLATPDMAAGQSVPAAEDVYALSSVVLRADTLLCGGERYVITSARGAIVHIRTPWGPLSERDLEAVQSATEALGSVVDYRVTCSRTRFNLILTGLPEAAATSSMGLSFLFEEGRLDSSGGSSVHPAPASPRQGAAD